MVSGVHVQPVAHCFTANKIIFIGVNYFYYHYFWRWCRFCMCRVGEVPVSCTNLSFSIIINEIQSSHALDNMAFSVNKFRFDR